MRILAFDLETTGLNIGTDRITEIGYALYDAGNPIPMQVRSNFIKQEQPLSDLIKELTGITDELLAEFGRDRAEVLEEFIDDLHKWKVELCVTHNGLYFDIPFIEAELKACNLILPPLPQADTKIDLPMEKELKHTNLVNMAAEHGFLNPFPHRAVFDALTCGKLFMQYPLSKILEVVHSPIVEVRAVVSYDDKDKAKAAGYFWDGPRKYWLKRMRLANFEKERNKCNFQVVVLGE